MFRIILLVCFLTMGCDEPFEKLDRVDQLHLMCREECYPLRVTFIGERCECEKEKLHGL